MADSHLETLWHKVSLSKKVVTEYVLKLGMYMYVLAAITLLIGLSVLVPSFRKPVLSEKIAGFLGGVLISLLGVGIGVLAMDSTRNDQRRAANKQASTAVVAEPRTESVVVPSSEPPAPAPAPTPSGRTELQNLAIISGLSESDPELVAQYNRLDSLCPPESASIGDMVVTMQRLVREESGREMGIVDIMRQLAIAQEGGVQANMKCSEVGGMLVELLAKGM